jgi:hypothetical protein
MGLLGNQHDRARVKLTELGQAIEGVFVHRAVVLGEAFTESDVPFARQDRRQLHESTETATGNPHI